MICMIYRRKLLLDGKVELARLYRGRYRLDSETKVTDVPLRTSDKRVAMEIIRHSDMRLTAKVYTDAGLLPVADAVLKLPSLSKPENTGTQIGTQNSFRDGHDLSNAGTTMAGIPLSDLSGNKQVRHKEDDLVNRPEWCAVQGSNL